MLGGGGRGVDKGQLEWNLDTWCPIHILGLMRMCKYQKKHHFQAFCGPWSGTGAPTTGVTGTYGPVQLVRVMFSAVLDARRRSELRRGSFGAPERSEAELRCFDMYHMRRIEDRSFFCLGSCIWVVLGVCKALVMAGHSKTNYFFGQTGSRLSAVPACRSTTLLHHGCCGGSLGVFM